MRIFPPEKLDSARVHTYNDHRMAMALSLARFGTDVEIENPDCVTKSFPDFFDSFGV